MRELLARPGFRRLLIGQAISGFGDWMTTVALIVLVLKVTGSSTAAGGILGLRLLPSLVAGPLAARVSRRIGRRRAMLAMDAVRVVIVVVLPLALTLWWIYVWAFLLEVAGLIFLPARDASVPMLAGRASDATASDAATGDATAGDAATGNGRAAEAEAQRLQRANALVLATSYGSIPLAAGAFGLVFLGLEDVGLAGTWLPFLIVFWIDALTFAASYLAIRGIDVTETDEPVSQGSSTRGGFIAGLRLPLVRAIIPALTCVVIGVGTLFSVGVAYIQEVLGAGGPVLGVLIALFGVGASVPLVARRVLDQLPPLLQVRAGVAIQGAVVAVMSLSGKILPNLLGALCYGAAAAAALVAAVTLLQERLEGTDRDLGFAVVHVTTQAGLAVAALAAGAATDLAPAVRWPLTGRLAPQQLVLLGAGVALVGGALLVRDPAAAERRKSLRATGRFGRLTRPIRDPGENREGVS
jgi:MFS family permease